MTGCQQVSQQSRSFHLPTPQRGSQCKPRRHRERPQVQRTPGARGGPPCPCCQLPACCLLTQSFGMQLSKQVCCSVKGRECPESQQPHTSQQAAGRHLLVSGRCLPVSGRLRWRWLCRISVLTTTHNKQIAKTHYMGTSPRSAGETGSAAQLFVPELYVRRRPHGAPKP